MPHIHPQAHRPLVGSEINERSTVRQMPGDWDQEHYLIDELEDNDNSYASWNLVMQRMYNIRNQNCTLKFRIAQQNVDALPSALYRAPVILFRYAQCP